MINPWRYLFNPTYRNQVKAERARKAYQQALIDLAVTYGRVMVEALSRRNVRSVYKNKQDKQETIVTVQFSQIEITADYFIFWVSYPLPFGVGIEHLEHEKIVRYLQMMCRANIICKYKPKEGFRYLLERRGRVGGLPRIIKYQAVMCKLPENLGQNGKLTFPVGVGENGRLFTCDLEQVAHFIIAGSTNYGKSNALAAMLCALAETYAPSDLEMIFIDLKDSDLHMLEDLPHLGIKQTSQESSEPLFDEEGNPLELKPPPHQKVIARPESVLTTLEWAMTERERRSAILKQAKVRNLRTYNKRYRASKMPYIVIVFDELAMIMLDSQYAKKAERIIARLVATSRSAGIHLILCTQVLQANVLPAIINGNVPGRLALYATTGTTAGLATGDGTYDAHSLIAGHVGRALFTGGGENKRLVQTPLITDHAIQKSVQLSVEKWAKTTHDVTEQAIFTYVYHELDSLYLWEDIYNHFKDRGITVEEVKKIAKANQVKFKNNEWLPTITLPEVETIFILAPAVRGPNGYARRLIPLNEWEEIQSSQPVTQPVPPVKIVTDEAIFTYALQHCAGEFNRDKIYEAFKGVGVSKGRISRLGRNYEGKTITLDNQDYQLEKPAQVNLSRRLIPVARRPSLEKYEIAHQKSRDPPLHLAKEKEKTKALTTET